MTGIDIASRSSAEIDNEKRDLKLEYKVHANQRTHNSSNNDIHTFGKAEVKASLTYYRVHSTPHSFDKKCSVRRCIVAAHVMRHAISL